MRLYSFFATCEECSFFPIKKAAQKSSLLYRFSFGACHPPITFRICIEFSFGARHPPDPYVSDLYQVDYEPALICIYDVAQKKVDLSNTVGDYNRLTVLIYYIIHSKS